MRKTLLAASAALLALTALTPAGCGGRTGGAGGGPANGLTGIGAPRGVWNAGHGAGYSAVDVNAAGLVVGYVLALAPEPLAQAEARVRRDLPSDASMDAPRAVAGVEGTACEVVRFHAAALRRVLPGPQAGLVAAVFMSANAVSLDLGRITSATVVTGGAALVSRC